MVVATCFIRLNRYHDALDVLQKVIERSPNNAQALYHYSFCHRASGSQKDAIESLTKIIAASSASSAAEDPSASSSASAAEDFTGSGHRGIALALPMHKVYEMRGTLFHEVQAHKLALMDLGKALAINPSW